MSEELSPPGSCAALVTATPSARAREFRAGWPVLLGCLIGVGIGMSSLPYYTFGVFLKELEASFGWSRTQISAAQTIGLMTIALMAPLVGGVIDRHGVRRPLAFSLVFLVAAFGLLGTVVHTLGEFIMIQIGLALLCTASSPIAFTRIINGWFIEARGLALGLMLMGTGITATFAPAFVTWVIERHGWRNAYLALGTLVATLLPLVLWLVRTAPHVATARIATTQSHVASLSRALRTRVFWQLAIVFCLQALAIGGLIVHFIPLLTDQGVERLTAASIAGIIGIAVIAGRLLIGALVDYFFAPHVAAATLALSGLGVISLAAGGPQLAPLAAFMIGFAVGAEVDLIGYLAARYFGLAAYGRIYGCLYGAFILGTGLSPLWIGLVFDRYASYRPALVASAVLLALVAIVFCSLPRFAADNGAVQSNA
jgi:MFS family permease